ncbi:MAG: glycosyltransferase family 2 protein [Planctomycetota bacterium]
MTRSPSGDPTESTVPFSRRTSQPREIELIIPPVRHAAHRWIILLLVSLGLESIALFGQWWLSPAVREPANVLYWVLTASIGFSVFRVVVLWVYYLNLRHEPSDPIESGPTVDVFTTIMRSEPFDMIVETLDAIQRLEYPHATYLLDSRWDDRTEELCRRLGVTRIRSDNVPGAKGGAINNALRQSSGEIVLVLDPDHVPHPRFLNYSVAPFVRDPRLGFVQVVQGYYNQNESFVAAGAAEQTYGYYGPIQMGMGGLGVAQAIGANCTFRREALESIAGHACHLAEDMVTAFRLHSRGWRSVYLPIVAARGLVPSDLASFFRQQYKWATGLFQILFRDVWPWVWGLAWRQRFVYLVNSTYYFTGLTAAVNLLLVPVFLLFDTWAVTVPVSDFLLHGLPYALTSTAIYFYSQLWIQDRRERGWHWRGMILKIGSWPIFVAGFLSALLGVTVRYIPTPKTRDDSPQLALVAPHLVIVALSAAAVAVNLAKEFNRGERFIVVLCLWNILMMLGTVLAANEKPLRKVWRRVWPRRRGTVEETLASCFDAEAEAGGSPALRTGQPRNLPHQTAAGDA